ncbi:PIG-L deacetylase family protein [Methanosarcina sp.]|uniref:PIG-L deacetylase family protein n=1 Tax=Methanosarcina sp. TaxID=2213 RepID=UPI003C741428
MDTNIKTILISPHSDDIAYSLGGALLKNYFEKPVVLVTVFMRSSFSPRLKLIDPEEITRIRRLEDIEFTKKIGIRYESFHFPEAPLRGKTSYEDIFGNSDPFSDPIYEDVYHSLLKLIKSSPDAVVVSPMSLGNNIDHLIIFEACSSICQENNIKISYYEDVPYASLLTLEQIKNKAFKISPRLKPCSIDITSMLHGKLANLKIYKTQIGRKIPKGVFTHAARIGIDSKGLIETHWNNNLLRKCFYYYVCIRKKQVYERIWE